MANDPYWNSVVLAMHMGVNGLRDLKGHSSTAIGNVAVESAVGSVGGYAAHFSGATDAINIAYMVANEFDLLDQNYDLSIDAFICMQDVSSANNIASYQSSETDGWRFFVDGTKLRFLSNHASGVVVDAASADGVIQQGAFHHVAYTFSQADTASRLFVDGVLVFEEFFGNAYTYVQPPSGTSLLLGNGAIGYLSEFRVTKALRYDAAFTTPTTQFPETPPQISGTVNDTNGPVVLTVRAHRSSDGAFCGDTTSSWLDGTFSAPCMDPSEHYVVCYGGSENALVYSNVLPI